MLTLNIQEFILPRCNILSIFKLLHSSLLFYYLKLISLYSLEIKSEMVDTIQGLLLLSSSALHLNNNIEGVHEVS